MPWYSKERPTPFDSSAITGLEFLNGDVLAQHYRQTWIEGQKYPLISFPSGLSRELSSSPASSKEHQVHVAGAVTLPYRATAAEAYSVVATLAKEHGFQVTQVAENQLHLVNPASGRLFHATFDNQHGILANMAMQPREAMELLTGEGRAILPPLYAGEKLGLKAIAPLKFLTPDANWTWYATEFDGEDLFFGLVSGLDVELGYFSLSELEGVRGPLGLPIERDLYFEPQPLEDLKRLHEW